MYRPWKKEIFVLSRRSLRGLPPRAIIVGEFVGIPRRGAAESMAEKPRDPGGNRRGAKN